MVHKPTHFTFPPAIISSLPMAAASLQTSTFRPPPNGTFCKSSGHQLKWVSIRNPSRARLERCRMLHSSRSPTQLPHRRLFKLFPFAFHGETETTETQQKEEQSSNQDPPESLIQDDLDEAVGGEDGGIEADTATAEKPTSAIIATLNLYKEALASNNESKVAEIEAFLMAVEDEKIDLQRKVAALSEELSNEKDRILRISADFDNFRKRTERDRLSLVTNAQGEVVENLLPVLDNFERAKAQIKVETEGEEKINNSYQSIYKQFVEILGSLSVVPVETRGKPFDPLLHEAIMREDSTEFEEGIIIEEFRKGFRLGDRLLRPAMVKVSAGPGPAKPESWEPSEGAETTSETSEEGSSGAESPEAQ